jgi:predicted negative regulator of RcsB-dependent stress response
VDRVTRKELKQDKFVAEVGHSVEYLQTHRSQLLRYTGIGAAVVLLAVGGWGWVKYQHAERQAALAKAIQIKDAGIGVAPNPTFMAFPTQEEKDKAIAKAFGDLAGKHPRSDEGAYANFLMGTLAVDNGNLMESEKFFKAAVDSGRTEPASVATLALADVYFASGKTAEAEKLLRGLVANPTTLVSKEQATLALVRVLAKSKPQEAKNLLGPLRSQTGAVSRAAVSEWGELFPNQ